MRYLIETSEGSKWVEAEYVQGKLWIHLNGNTFVVDEEKSKSRRSSKADGSHDGNLMAPMPGKITKILAALNQEVKKGEPLLVMEAMKMEYTIKASADGKILNLNCQVGDQVKIGQKLVELQK